MAGFITLEDAKAHLRIDDGEDDTTIQSLIDAASRHVERMTGYVAEQREESFSFDFFGSQLELRLRPIATETIEVSYLDGNGEEQPFTDVRVIEKNGTVRVLPAIGSCWPGAACAGGAVSVTATVGFADTAAAPDTIKHAVRLCVKAWFDGCAEEELPPAVGMLLDDERAQRV